MRKSNSQTSTNDPGFIDDKLIIGDVECIWWDEKVYLLVDQTRLYNFLFMSFKVIHNKPKQYHYWFQTKGGTHSICVFVLPFNLVTCINILQDIIVQVLCFGSYVQIWSSYYNVLETWILCSGPLFNTYSGLSYGEKSKVFVCEQIYSAGAVQKVFSLESQRK
eukprot:80285_1